MNKKIALFTGTILLSSSLFIGSSSPAFAVDVPAGPIWNNEHAKTVCPAVCTAAGGTWNGNWKTVIPNKSSVCGCD